MGAELRRAVEAARFARLGLWIAGRGGAPVDKADGDVAAGGGQLAPERGKVLWRGIPVVVDRPRGYVQQGVDSTGAAWRRVYHVDYGYIEGTKGGDGEGLDVFLGGDEAAPDAHWILQRKLDGTFDEYKVMLGFDSPKVARQMYEAHVPRAYFGSMCSMPVEMMKALLGIDPVEDVAKAEGLVRKIAESLTQRGSSRGESVAVAIAKGASAAQMLVEAGPPIEWSGAVASILGEDGRSRVKAFWEALDPRDRERVEAAFAAQFSAEEGTVAPPDATLIAHLEESYAEVSKGLPPRDVKLVKVDATAAYRFAKETPAPAGELRYVLGIVLEPDVVDAQDDTYSAEEIRKTAWDYLVHFRNVGLMHRGFVNGKVRLVESYVAPADFDVDGTKIAKGTWMMGLQFVDDELWNMVKTGQLTGLSIGGWAKKNPIPPTS